LETTSNSGVTLTSMETGTKTVTGWEIGDGFLVFDRNENGSNRFNGGGKLFGVDTVQSKRRKSTDLMHYEIFDSKLRDGV